MVTMNVTCKIIGRQGDCWARADEDDKPIADGDSRRHLGRAEHCEWWHCMMILEPKQCWFVWSVWSVFFCNHIVMDGNATYDLYWFVAMCIQNSFPVRRWNSWINIYVSIVEGVKSGEKQFSIGGRSPIHYQSCFSSHEGYSRAIRRMTACSVCSCHGLPKDGRHGSCRFANVSLSRAETCPPKSSYRRGDSSALGKQNFGGPAYTGQTIAVPTPQLGRNTNCWSFGSLSRQVLPGHGHTNGAAKHLSGGGHGRKMVEVNFRDHN